MIRRRLRGYTTIMKFCQFVSGSLFQIIVDVRDLRSTLPSLIHKKGMEIIPLTLEVSAPGSRENGRAVVGAKNLVPVGVRAWFSDSLFL